MGFKISWIALQGVSKADAVQRLGLVDTGVPDEANEAKFSVAQLADDWSIVWSNNCDWATPARCLAAALRGHAVGLSLHEGVMRSEAYAARDGAVQWHVSHDGQEPGFNYSSDGMVPGLGDVVTRLGAEQAAADAADGIGADCAFDIPIEVAAAIVGFRHDDWELPSGGRPNWTIAEKVR